MTPIRTAARTILGALFVGSGWLALRHPDRLVPRAKPVTDRLSPALQAASLPTDRILARVVDALVAPSR